MKVECSQCHGDKAWKPAHFDHKLLAPSVLRGSCKSCQQTEAWKPATFDRDKYFVLDRDHEAPCDTCHRNNDYSRYTCYGCHEHSEAKVRAEHLEEGIRDFQDCVECHRDPRVEPQKGRGRGGRERD